MYMNMSMQKCTSTTHLKFELKEDSCLSQDGFYAILTIISIGYGSTLLTKVVACIWGHIASTRSHT